MKEGFIDIVGVNRYVAEKTGMLELWDTIYITHKINHVDHANMIFTFEHVAFLGYPLQSADMNLNFKRKCQ